MSNFHRVMLGLTGLVLFWLLGTAGKMDELQAEADYAQCRKMVEAGAWPEEQCPAKEVR